jgi:hypothetical protein
MIDREHTCKHASVMMSETRKKPDVEARQYVTSRVSRPINRMGSRSHSQKPKHDFCEVLVVVELEVMNSVLITPVRALFGEEVGINTRNNHHSLLV